MKKLLLFFGVLFLFGCNEVSAKSDYYNATMRDSVADTIGNLSEVSKLELADKYGTMIGSMPIVIWELGDQLPITVVSDETNVIAVIYRDYPIEFIETLINDYEIEVDEKMVAVLDRNDNLFDDYNTEESFALQKHAVGVGEDNSSAIVLNNFGSNKGNTFKQYDIYVVFDDYALEQWKQVFLQDELFYEQQLQDAHEKSVSDTDGAYQEWYDAMIKSGRDPKELQQQNKELQDTLDSIWGN